MTSPRPTIAPATVLERELELTQLAEALKLAQEAHGQVVLIEAVAGLGKTTLLGAASDMADEAGFSSLRARATELERDFAYGCVRQLLEPVVARASTSQRERLFHGAAALSRPLFAPAGFPEPPPSADSAFSILHGLYWLLSNIADEGPVALVIDDVHWADAESLRFLNYVAPRADGIALLVAAAARTEDDVNPDLARLAAGPETTTLRPRPLSTGATVRVCERMLGSSVAPEFAAACREATGGNPFLLEALLREVSERGLAPDSDDAAQVVGIGPTSVAEAVLLRLASRPSATALVRAVAVLGDGAALTEAASLGGLPDDEAASAADLLVSLAVLQPGERLQFAHPIVREAVYAEIGAHERAKAHAEAARMLAAGGASEERVAAQLMAAEPAGDPERVELLRRVANDALARGAPTAAAAWLARALAEPPPPTARGDLLLELGWAELRLAKPSAADHLAEAIEAIQEPARMAQAARMLGNAFTMSERADRAVETLDAAIRRVEPEDPELALTLEADLAAHAQQASRDERGPAAKRLDRHRKLEGATPGERLVLAFLAFEDARAAESASEAAAFIEEALAGGRLLREKEIDVAGAFYLLMVGLRATDALELAESSLDEALADARERASIPAQAFVLAHHGYVAMRQGAVSRAEADARTALELFTAHDIRLGATLALGVLIESLVEEGEIERAEEVLRSSGVDEIAPGMARNPLLEARSILRLAQGRTREGLDDVLEFGRRDELWGGANPLASRWRSRAALAHAAIGDAEEAHALAREDLERAERWGAASGIGIALRAVGLLERSAPSVDHLRRAVEVLAASPARLEHARALVDLGAALRRSNHRTEARASLEEGQALAAQCGARALVDRARTEIRAAGGRSSEPEEQLTASERRVAELAAEGHSNPEIAQALFVTRKTVETHLGRVYRKLEIAGRGELGDALGSERSGR